jgi:hypothetical protein
MNIYLIVIGVLAILALAAMLKVRKMTQYKISKEKDSKGIEKWFVKVRKGFSYYYLEQTMDPPGFADDKFSTSKIQVSGQETERLANNVIINHRMSTVNGIEIEGE